MKNRPQMSLSSGALYDMTNIVRFRERALSEKLTSIGLTLPEWRVLRIIHSFPEAIPMSIVIEHSQSDRSTLGRTVDKLVNRGWVEKLADPSDKRAFRVRYLEASVNIYHQAYALVADYDASMIERLSEEDRQLLAALLQRIPQRMQE
ncbi:MarR family transcriptional regulator [Klebsiella aerogenes]|nr:MarR family transcriptional regulator [Klebsiella aerogenes]